MILQKELLITDVLQNNADRLGNEVSLVELTPDILEKHEKKWREFELVEPVTTIDYRREMTWQEFNDQANQFANMLLSKGIKKGDRVAIILMNCLEWLPVYFGALRAGAVVVPFNFRYTSDEIAYCLTLAEADILIFGEEFTDRIEEIYTTIPRLQTFLYVGERSPEFSENYFELLPKQETNNPNIIIEPDDDAAIYFSSGTTGFPKGILHSHRSLMSACYTENQHHKQTKEDTFLCIPPLYHTGAKMHWFGSFLVGGKGVLLRGVKPEWIIRAISDEKVSVVFLLVPWAQDILDAIDREEIDLSDHDLSQWRLMHIGAQPVPPSLIKRWKTVFPEHQYDTNYGLSESMGPGCVHLGMENIRKVGAIGKAGHNWQVIIVDEKANPVKNGDVGELAVSGPGVMKCYYNDPQATANVLKNGWLLTGDMARMDEEGFIYLVDRKKDVIISGGENIYPVQIEDFLRSHNAVKDAAVIGLLDPRLGEQAAAIIEIKPGCHLTEEALFEYCNDLPRYKRPRKIIFSQVPRNPTGKIEKVKLREKYCADGLVGAQTSN